MPSTVCAGNHRRLPIGCYGTGKMDTGERVPCVVDMTDRLIVQAKHPNPLVLAVVDLRGIHIFSLLVVRLI